MTITAVELRKLLPTLDDLQFSVLLRTVLGIKTEERAAALTPFEVLQAGLYEWLTHLGFITDGQCRLILHHLAAALTEYMRVYAQETDKPVFMLSIVESRWVSWAFLHRWLDFIYEEFIDELPCPGVTYICCDIGALQTRMAQWLSRLGGQDEGSQHHAAAGDNQPGAAGEDHAPQ